MKLFVRRASAIAFLGAVWTLTSPGAASAANLLGDTINAMVRRTTDPVGTNHFSLSTAVVTSDLEFSAINGDYEITADFQASDFVNLTVDRIPISPNASAPNYRFTFTDLDFTPASVIVGVTRFGGTPGVGISDVVFGPSSAEFTLGKTFLSTGGAFGVSVRFDTIEIPEPAALTLISLAASALLGMSRRWCRVKLGAGA